MKAALEQERSLRSSEWATAGSKRVNESRKRQQHNRKLQEKVVLSNRAKVRAVQDEEAVLQRKREARQKQFEEDMRQRVLDANALQIKMAQTESDTEAKERAEGTRARLELASALNKVREANLEQKREMTESIVSARWATAAAKSACEMIASRVGAEKREQALSGKALREQRDRQYLERARENKARAENTRASAKKSMKQALEARKAHAIKERKNDILVGQERLDGRVTGCDRDARHGGRCPWGDRAPSERGVSEVLHDEAVHSAVYERVCIGACALKHRI